jgi:hypothetical protein
MMERLLVALGTAFLCAGPTLAQTPSAAPPPLPPAAAADPKPAPPPDAKPAPLPAGCCPAAEGCADVDGQFWAAADFLVAWFSGDRLPPLVTTSPAGTARASAGVLGLGTTTTLFGDSVVNRDARVGFRLGFGYWFEPERLCGVEAGGMMLESQATLFAASSSGTPILARPFFNTSTGAQDAALIAFPGSSSGAIAARAASGNFYEAHVDLTGNLLSTESCRVDSIFGYRFYRYDEGLSIQQSITNSPTFVPGTQFLGRDDFATKNEYHGGDLGFRTLLTRDDFSLCLLTKLGVGRVSRTVKINGGEVIEVPGEAPVVQAGNLLALPTTNIGSHHSDDWTVLPELGVTLGWRVSPGVHVTVGYSLLWLDRIARAADQIDFAVNPTLLPSAGGTPTGPNRPAFEFVRNDAWLQSVSLGVEFTY